MKSKREYEFISRDNIVKILNDEEAARVRLPATASQLVEGDEFIDLAEVERGVQRAGQLKPLSNVLPRKALHDNTWRKIVANLDAWRLMVQPRSHSSKQP